VASTARRVRGVHGRATVWTPEQPAFVGPAQSVTAQLTSSDSNAAYGKIFTRPFRFERPGRTLSSTHGTATLRLPTPTGYRFCRKELSRQIFTRRISRRRYRCGRRRRILTKRPRPVSARLDFDLHIGKSAGHRTPPARALGMAARFPQYHRICILFESAHEVPPFSSIRGNRRYETLSRTTRGGSQARPCLDRLSCVFSSVTSVRSIVWSVALWSGGASLQPAPRTGFVVSNVEKLVRGTVPSAIITSSGVPADSIGTATSVCLKPNKQTVDHEDQLLNFLVNRLDEEVSLSLANNAEITAEDIYEVLVGACADRTSVSRSVRRARTHPLEHGPLPSSDEVRAGTARTSR